MAKFGSGKKPKNQGSHAAPHVQAPRHSPKPGRDKPAPQNPQNHRGFHSTGVHGTNPGTK